LRGDEVSGHELGTVSDRGVAAGGRGGRHTDTPTLRVCASVKSRPSGDVGVTKTRNKKHLRVGDPEQSISLEPARHENISSSRARFPGAAGDHAGGRDFPLTPRTSSVLELDTLSDNTPNASTRELVTSTRRVVKPEVVICYATSTTSRGWGGLAQARGDERRWNRRERAAEWKDRGLLPTQPPCPAGRGVLR